MARSVLIQSYAPAPLPAWQQRCVDSVRRWAQEAGWEYRYVDDRLLEVVPAWYRERCGPLKLPVTDLGRLLLMRQALAEPGCEEALWVDADVLVFAPGLEPRRAEGFGFVRELWTWRAAGGSLRVRQAVNNALVYMRRGVAELERYIEACEHAVASTPQEKLKPYTVGTLLLSVRDQRARLPLIAGAGLLSPALLADLAAGGGELARHYAGLLDAPLACANLCGSLLGRETAGTVLDEATMELAVERLLASRGAAINAPR
jgi:hypothetical protein